MLTQALDILKKYWGFDSFRDTQIPILKDAIAGQDVLALLPTGGGKSLCFQIPGLLTNKLTLVITPLISLMEDQVKNLKRKGIQACALTGTMTYKEIDIVLNNAVFGGYQFLYISPERIQTIMFKERLKQMTIGLVVIDEAHCISEWGHDFRPAYRNIKTIREIRPELPMMALTATATKGVKEDIVKQLGLKKVALHEAHFERKNLSYEIIETQNKMGSVLSYCHGKENMSGIVYCRTRKGVKDLHKVFTANKLTAGMYHGGMSSEDRSSALNFWLNGIFPIMIATNAFGMGIDKPNVRFVLHYDFPDNLEAYTQEAGRAGRDGQASRAIAFVEGDETELLSNNFEKKFPPIQHIKQVYEMVCNHLRMAVGSGKDETYPIDLGKFCEEYRLDYLETYNSFKILETSGEFIFNEASHKPTKIKIVLSQIELYNVQIKNPNLHPLIQLLTNGYANISDDFCEINESLLAKKLKIPIESINHQLEFLKTSGSIDLIEKTWLPTLTFTEARRPEAYIQLSYESYQKRKEIAESKYQSVVKYLNLDSCRSVAILNYFEQDGKNCGLCDHCLRQQIDFKEIEKFILDALVLPLSYQELQERMSVKGDDLKKVLRSLQLEQKIQLIDGKFYRS